MRHQKPASSSQMQLPFVVDHEFDDVDELGEVTRSWDLDFRQLNLGGFTGSVRQAVLGPIHLAKTTLAGVLHQQGSTPADLWTIAFPGARNMEFCWRGHTVGDTDLLIHQPGGEFESISQHDFELLLLSVSLEHLGDAGRRMNVPVSERSLKGLEIATCEAEIVGSLRNLVTVALALLIDGRNLPESVERRACDLLVQGLAPGLRSGHRPRQGRQRKHLDAAIRIARKQARQIHSVKDLSSASGASERTLRRGFTERFGISPKTYLQAQRLIGVRRQLRVAAGDVSIADIANAWGFWHMGQFAADYKRQFGELPSETVQRVRGF